MLFILVLDLHGKRLGNDLTGHIGIASLLDWEKVSSENNNKSKVIIFQKIGNLTRPLLVINLNNYFQQPNYK